MANDILTIMAGACFDVFLSYSKSDQAAVEVLAKKLLEHGIVPWLDKWNLVPGVAWQPEIESALCECRSCAIFVGKSGLGPWQNEEMRAAIQRRVADRQGRFRVIPVLLPGANKNGSNNLPTFLIAATWVEFSEGLEDRDAFHRFVSGIRGLQPGPISSEESQTEWVLVLSATVDDVTKPVAEAILEHLRTLSGDVTLTIKKITRGSVRIIFRGSTDGFRKLKELADTGGLTSMFGLAVNELTPVGTGASVISHSQLSDEDLVFACASSKETNVWEAFIQRFHSTIAAAVYRTTSRYGVEWQDNLEDLVQEAYRAFYDPTRNVLQKFELRQSGSARAFLRSVTTKVVADYMSKARRETNLALSDRDAEAEYERSATATGSGSESFIERSMLMQEMDLALRQSKAPNAERDRQIFWLHYRMGMTTREISELPSINLSTKAVESILFRVTKFIRHKLTDSPGRGPLKSLRRVGPAIQWWLEPESTA